MRLEDEEELGDSIKNRLIVDFSASIELHSLRVAQIRCCYFELQHPEKHVETRVFLGGKAQEALKVIDGLLSALESRLRQRF